MMANPVSLREKPRVAKAGDLILCACFGLLGDGLDGDTKTPTVGNLDTVKRVASPKHDQKRKLRSPLRWRIFGQVHFRVFSAEFPLR